MFRHRHGPPRNFGPDVWPRREDTLWISSTSLPTSTSSRVGRPKRTRAAATGDSKSLRPGGPTNASPGFPRCHPGEDVFHREARCITEPPAYAGSRGIATADAFNPYGSLRPALLLIRTALRRQWFMTSGSSMRVGWLPSLPLRISMRAMGFFDNRPNGSNRQTTITKSPDRRYSICE